MKPNKRYITSALIVSVLVIFSISCKKSKLFKDTEAPEITLLGPDTVDLPKGSAAADFGATATDKRSGDCSATIKSNWDSIVKLNKLGLYQVTYTVGDKSNNIAQKKRFLRIVYNNPLPLGEYACIRYFSVAYLADTASCSFMIYRTVQPDTYLAAMSVAPTVQVLGNSYSPKEFLFVALKNDNTSFSADAGDFKGIGTYDSASKKLSIDISRSVFVALNRTDVYRVKYIIDLSKSK